MIEQIKPNAWKFTCDVCGKGLKEVPLNWHYIEGRWERLDSPLDYCPACRQRESQPKPTKKPSKQKKIKLVDKIQDIIFVTEWHHPDKDKGLIIAKEIAKLIANNYRRRKKV
jgi:hypothetical protein